MPLPLVTIRNVSRGAFDFFGNSSRELSAG
jgi:hypothetical protein